MEIAACFSHFWQLEVGDFDTPPQIFNTCVWKVLPALRYSAQRKLKAAPGVITEDALQRLREAAKMEVQLNNDLPVMILQWTFVDCCTAMD